jgi:hypothetical protein
MEFCNSRRAENSQGATPQKLDTHFIDRSMRCLDIRNSQVSPPNYFPGPHEIESKAGRGRYAQALDPSLRFRGHRRLSLILA